MYHTNKKRRSNLKTGIKYIELFLPPSIAYVSILSFQKYVCDKCGKQFTEKRSLTRHMKTYNALVSGSSGNILGSTDGLLEDWGLWFYLKWDGSVHFSRNGTPYFHTTNHNLQDQPVVWFYFEKRRHWRTMLLPLQKLNFCSFTKTLNLPTICFKSYLPLDFINSDNCIID
jgi:hypothetical protein